MKINKPLTFIFMGRSGSGKGTQIELLKNYISTLNTNIGTYNFVMGDIFRSFMKEKGYIQNFVREETGKGHLLPDLIANNLFIGELLKNFEPKDHLYIDGIPRSIAQAEALIELINFYHRDDVFILDIKVSKDEVEKRMLQRGRADDNKEAIAARHSFYDENVIPAVQYLKEKSNFKYIEINGEKSTEKVNNEIINKLNLQDEE